MAEIFDDVDVRELIATVCSVLNDMGVDTREVWLDVDKFEELCEKTQRTLGDE